MLSKSNMGAGKLIVLEGVDGTGKSTHAKRLAAQFELLHYREPGSLSSAEAIRDTLLSHSLSPMAQALMFIAARTEFVREVLAPSLAAGRNVILERYFYSTLAYQQGALPEHIFEDLHAWMPKPNEVILLECPVSVSRSRDANPHEATVAGKDADFFERIKRNYRKVLENTPHTIVDTDVPMKEVYAALENIVEKRLSA